MRRAISGGVFSLMPLSKGNYRESFQLNACRATPSHRGERAVGSQRLCSEETLERVHPAIKKVGESAACLSVANSATRIATAHARVCCTAA
jgi:hypothetical protein